MNATFCFVFFFVNLLTPQQSLIMKLAFFWISFLVRYRNEPRGENASARKTSRRGGSEWPTGNCLTTNIKVQLISIISHPWMFVVNQSFWHKADKCSVTALLQYHPQSLDGAKENTFHFSSIVDITGWIYLSNVVKDMSDKCCSCLKKNLWIILLKLMKCYGIKAGSVCASSISWLLILG